MATSPSDDDLVDVWSVISALCTSRRDVFFAALGPLGLTPPHGFGLMSLRAGPVRMGDLAATMTCDASYVTSVVDRLQELGLATRREAEGDRRVREVALTVKGRRVADRLTRLFSDPPGELEALSTTDRAHLAQILRKLPPVHQPAGRSPWRT